MPLTDYTGALGVKRAAHLLRRATFGATKQKIDQFAAYTPDQAITELFRQTLDMPLPPIDPKTGQEWMTTGPTDANSKTYDLQMFFKSWFMGQMMSPGISSSSNLNLAWSAREKVVFFLHTHFTTIREKVDDSRALYFQNQLFRLFALDALNPDPDINFKMLTVKICVDSAMLKVLDGTSNVAGNPNENYARELLELYSIGRGLEGVVPPPTNGDYHVFTEQDVKMAARVLSGWTTDDDYLTMDELTLLPRGTVRGGITNASSHDNDTDPPKQFSSRFNNTIIEGDPTLMNGTSATEESALDEIQQLIDMIYTQSETPLAAAKNICWKIYRFYVWGPHSSDESIPIDSDIITDMANLFSSNGYKLQPVIEALLKSTHFYESAAGVTDDNFGGIIKSPLDLVIGSLRLFDIQPPDMATDPQAFYDFYYVLRDQIMYEQGMSFYDPYDVAGYEAYHQYPIYHRFWITPSNLTIRYDFIRYLITESLTDKYQGLPKVNVYQFVSTNFAAVAASAPDLVVELSKYFFPVTDNLDYNDANDSAAAPPGLTAPRLNYFKQKLLGGFDDAYWETRWNEGAGDLRTQLEFLFNAMLQSPEFQLS
ncbi:MAG TPA: DUF1800 family protein [Ohtaekwangia sp.]